MKHLIKVFTLILLIICSKMYLNASIIDGTTLVPQYRPFSNIDYDGKLKYQLLLDSIEINTGEQLPIILYIVPTSQNYSPAFCSFPILDSRAYLINDKHMRIVLPNGDDVVLRKTSKNQYSSELGTCIAEITPNRTIKFETNFNETYIFKKGRVSNLKLRNGSTLRWIRNKSVSKLVYKPLSGEDYTIVERQTSLNKITILINNRKFCLLLSDANDIQLNKNISKNGNLLLTKIISDDLQYDFDYLQEDNNLSIDIFRNGLGFTKLVCDIETQLAIQIGDWEYEYFVNDTVWIYRRKLKNSTHVEELKVDPMHRIYQISSSHWRFYQQNFSGILQNLYDNPIILEASTPFSTGKSIRFDYDGEGNLIDTTE